MKAELGLPPSFAVQTPSGGLHYYLSARAEVFQTRAHVVNAITGKESFAIEGFPG